MVSPEHPQPRHRRHRARRARRARGRRRLLDPVRPRHAAAPRRHVGAAAALPPRLNRPSSGGARRHHQGGPAARFVSIRISYDWGTIIQSQLLDTTPDTGSYGDAPLQVGQSFYDPLSGVTITTTAVANGVATVNVSWGADTTPPSTPSNVTAASTGTTTARLSWTASTDNIGVAGYRVARDGGTPVTVTTTSFDDTGLTGGQTYQYTVVAFDAAGNTSGVATKSWTQPIPDTTAPTAFTLSKSTTKSKLTLSWTASTDNVAVTGYRVYRNNVLVTTLAASARSWSDSLRKGTTTYYVVAFDAAGNTKASNTLQNVK